MPQQAASEGPLICPRCGAETTLENTASIVKGTRAILSDSASFVCGACGANLVMIGRISKPGDYHVFVKGPRARLYWIVERFIWSAWIPPQVQIAVVLGLGWIFFLAISLIVRAAIAK